MEESKKATTISTDDAVRALLDELAKKTAKLVIANLEGNLLLRPRLLNYEQAAKYLGFVTADRSGPSVSALRQRKMEGQFPEECSITIGKAVRWDVEALDRWIDSKKLGKRAARTGLSRRKT